MSAASSIVVGQTLETPTVKALDNWCGGLLADFLEVLDTRIRDVALPYQVRAGSTTHSA